MAVLRRQATIQRVDGDWLEVRIAATTCAGCAGRCGLIRPAGPAAWGQPRWRLPQPPGSRLRCGDRVELRLPARRFAQASLAGLGLPLLALLAGALLGGAALPVTPDPGVLAGACGGLAAGLWLARRSRPLRRRDIELVPVRAAVADA
ncbi:MAG: hypothetical protein D6727_08630 [Gammaproteobacteria bacterium]|nr:MAG: hypothetical protein D6727_08630 [Gammaproteobacteria bacterium]